MADQDADLKEKKRKKALRRMGKIVGQAWNLNKAEPFYTSPNTPAAPAAGGGDKPEPIYCLTSLGQKVDDQGYKHGRHGWEDFARDIGGVYNRHIQR
eukprot:scaffold5048_cov121-Cylindrotheca_fusiformis.AAC.4